MDPTFVALRNATVPKFNDTIAQGIATVHIPHAMRYIDRVFRSISREFPEGLVYVDYDRCLPTEEYKEGARKRTPTKTNKRVDTKLKKAPKAAADSARSDVFLAKFFFRYKGEDLAPRYLYLPFVSKRRGGLFTLAGSRFVISPILQDIVISPDEGSVFAQLLCIKLIFKRLDYDFQVDGRNRTVKVTWSNVYNKTEEMKKLEPTVKMQTCLAHYLFCKYGVTESFERYYGITPVFGEDDINTTNYPSDDWVICSSRGIVPAGNSRLDYVRPKLRVAIRRDQYDQNVEDFVGALFYLVDHFSKRLILKDINNQWLWRVLMGHILWTGDMNEGLLHDKIRDHFKSNDQYMDLITQQKLKSLGIEVEDIYDFFMHVIKNCNHWLLQESEKISSMYGKELSILNYVLYDITRSIVDTNFAIHAAHRRSITDPRRPLTKEAIEEIFKKNLKPGRIFGITNGKAGVTSISIPGDNMAFKLTSMLVPQTSSNKNAKHDSGTDGSAKILDASISEIGGYLNIQKTAPTGRTRLSQYATLTDGFITAPNIENADIVNRTQDKIRRR